MIAGSITETDDKIILSSLKRLVREADIKRLFERLACVSVVYVREADNKQPIKEDSVKSLATGSSTG